MNWGCPYVDRIWKTYKKQCIIAGVALAAVLIPLYLYFMFQTGIWYQDAFLAKQRDGSFQGKKDGIHYVLHITPTQNGAQIDFSVDGQSRPYEVVKTELDGTPGAQFYENGTPVFEGRVLTSNARTHDYMIATKDFDIVDGLDFHIRGDAEPEPVEYFPGYGTQYGWTVMRLEESCDTRGEPLMLLPALIVAGGYPVSRLVFCASLPTVCRWRLRAERILSLLADDRARCAGYCQYHFPVDGTA